MPRDSAYLLTTLKYQRKNGLFTYYTWGWEIKNFATPEESRVGVQLRRKIVLVSSKRATDF